MKRSILFVGSETNLGHSLLDKISAPSSVILASTNLAKKQVQENSIHWHQSSPVSAKNLILEADRLLNPLEEIWVCLPTWLATDDLTFLSLPAIENIVNETLRGNLYLFREAQRFAQERELALRFFFSIENRNNVPPLLSLVYEGLGAFLRSYQKSNIPKNLKLIVFENNGSDILGFLEEVTKSLELKNESGWFVYPKSFFPWQGTKHRRSIV